MRPPRPASIARRHRRHAAGVGGFGTEEEAAEIGEDVRRLFGGPVEGAHSEQGDGDTAFFEGATQQPGGEQHIGGYVHQGRPGEQGGPEF